MSNATVPAAYTLLKQSLTALRAGQESYAQFVTDLFTDFEALNGRLSQAEQQLVGQRQQLVELSSSAAEGVQSATNDNNGDDPALQIRVVELESERQALEEELENIRGRAVHMAEVITGQKRQLSDEHAQWRSELRQLRRILDKQTSWITQQSDSTVSEPGSKVGRRGGSVSPEHAGLALLPTDVDDFGDFAAEPTTANSPAADDEDALPVAAETNDPELESVLSQFEILPKEASRRRKK